MAIEGLKPRGADALAVDGCNEDSDIDCEKSKAGECRGPMEEETTGFKSISKVAERGECDAEPLVGK